MSVEDCLAHKWLGEESPERPLALEPSAPPTVSAVESEGEEKDPASSTSDSMDEEELSADVVVAQTEEIKSAQDLEEDHSSLQSFCDDQSEDGGASNSDKENSLVFNCNSSSSNL